VVEAAVSELVLDVVVVKEVVVVGATNNELEADEVTFQSQSCQLEFPG